ncbi:hypothetical protein [Mucilaginibacter psychrotolerans]|uniref:Outer membrane protein beta-barrel domain-containing protein n=1 Tax=Mucilaginibacter psychrotolerans TaxID=1524096 RepID=A0A4Y8S580_9SPHI|nr:hypothetical protein [Mucilaginibacter psychrotolerans]TFF33896.1 hypothetical protein E2R66_23755 [Mucilaginibacter psychrotolerans]
MAPQIKPRTKRCVATLSLVLSLFIFCKAHAQTRGMNADGDVLSGSNRSSGGAVRQDGWLIAFNGGYESPMGDLKDSYKGSPTFGFSVMRRMDHLLYSGTIDYRSYKPLADKIQISYDGTDYYGATFSNYKGIGAYLGIAYELSAGDINFYGGVNGGFVLVSYKITVDDTNFSSIESLSNGQSTYIAPKVGFNFMLSNNIGIAVEGRYSLGVVGGNYNTRSGGSTTPGFNSVAGNLFLTYSF